MAEQDTAPLPTGFQVRLDPGTRSRDGGRTLYGGSGGRMVHLRPAALERLQPTGTLEVGDPTSARLARMLLERGLAHPCWRPGTDDRLADVTVVVPVLDAPLQVDRLLRRLPGVAVVVVDDGSTDPAALAAVCRRHGARLLRHPVCRGPAAARNTGLATVRTPAVAFVDADVVLDRDALVALHRHLDDPRVALAAPRVLGLEEGGGPLARYEAARSSLDLGPEPALVRPHARVSYVPSAMMLARTGVLGTGFDERMRVAEDVDLVWRLSRTHDVRYDPAIQVRHEHRTGTRAWLRRKAFYGTGAAPLARRHGSAVAPVVSPAWGLVVAGALLAQRRWSLPVAAVTTVVAELALARRLTGSRAPHRDAAAVIGLGLHATLAQTGSALLRHHWPVTAALAPFSARVRRAALAMTVLDAVLDHRRHAPGTDLVRYAVLRRADDLAYGLGLWRGCLAERSPRALLPLIRVRAAAPAHPRPDQSPDPT
ncbi:mycofactocin biosynthesis glycosyltransferase MftF [Janibacter alkaliphilus]|uniref:Mycofactocin system glycosyltransferase n=1 Tax=Janibacter alkaliphilus TaxID=1069963 RepID=A0A852XGR0_9MICO|nr:mycofactocin system glycosyltransferase [Janibacter alkaliphilus]